MHPIQIRFNCEDGEETCGYTDEKKARKALCFCAVRK